MSPDVDVGPGMSVGVANSKEPIVDVVVFKEM